MSKIALVAIFAFASLNILAQKEVKYQGQEYSLAIQRIEFEGLVLVKERFPVTVKIIVLTHFKEEDIPKIHEQFGSTKYALSIQESVVNNAARIVFGKYSLEELLSIKRELFENELAIHITKKLEELNIHLNEILIEKILPPENIQHILEEKYIALQEIERQKHLMEAEKKKLEIKKMQIEAETERNLILDKSLTEKVLQLKYIETLNKLAESSNAKVIIFSDEKVNIPKMLKEE